MKNLLLFQLSAATIIVLILQIFIPQFYFSGIDIIPDIILVFLTYIGFRYGALTTVVLGFITGLCQDFITQVELLGIMAFAKSAIGFGLGSLILYHTIWSRKFRLIFIFLMYLVHYLVYYFVKLNSSPIEYSVYFQVILLNAAVCFSLLILVDFSIFKKEITSN